MAILRLSIHWPMLRRLACLMAPLAAMGCGPAADAQAPPAAYVETSEDAELTEAWVRILRDDDEAPLAMETAVVRFVPADQFDPDREPGDYEQYVDLVGAVHIADQAYYDKLNERFEGYDAVLYELVAAKGTVVPRGRGTSNSHPLGALQNAMKSMLEVEHQLEQIDYTRPNFVHADLSPDEFFESMDDRDESFIELYFRIMGASLAQQSEQSAAGESPELEFMAAMLSEERPRRFKILLAKQFESMESVMLALSGPQGSTLITERNTRALDVLQEQLDEGQERLAIFYGAGHLADMTEQLEKRFGMRPVLVEWLQAWDLRSKK
jgi:hypothetical protein